MGSEIIVKTECFSPEPTAELLGFIKCKMCELTVEDELLLDHVAREHFQFRRYRCPDCGFAQNYREKMVRHSIQALHSEEFIDEAENREYMHGVISKVMEDSRAYTLTLRAQNIALTQIPQPAKPLEPIIAHQSTDSILPQPPPVFSNGSEKHASDPPTAAQGDAANESAGERLLLDMSSDDSPAGESSSENEQERSPPGDPPLSEGEGNGTNMSGISRSSEEAVVPPPKEVEPPRMTRSKAKLSTAGVPVPEGGVSAPSQGSPEKAAEKSTPRKISAGKSLKAVKMEVVAAEEHLAEESPESSEFDETEGENESGRHVYAIVKPEFDNLARREQPYIGFPPPRVRETPPAEVGAHLTQEAVVQQDPEARGGEQVLQGKHYGCHHGELIRARDGELPGDDPSLKKTAKASVELQGNLIAADARSAQSTPVPGIVAPGNEDENHDDSLEHGSPPVGEEVDATKSSGAAVISPEFSAGNSNSSKKNEQSRDQKRKRRQSPSVANDADRLRLVQPSAEDSFAKRLEEQRSNMAATEAFMEKNQLAGNLNAMCETPHLFSQRQLSSLDALIAVDPVQFFRLKAQEKGGHHHLAEATSKRGEKEKIDSHHHDKEKMSDHHGESSKLNTSLGGLEMESLESEAESEVSEEHSSASDADAEDNAPLALKRSKLLGIRGRLAKAARKGKKMEKQGSHKNMILQSSAAGRRPVVVLQRMASARARMTCAYDPHKKNDMPERLNRMRRGSAGNKRDGGQHQGPDREPKSPKLSAAAPNADHTYTSDSSSAVPPSSPRKTTSPYEGVRVKTVVRSSWPASFTLPGTPPKDPPSFIKPRATKSFSDKTKSALEIAEELLRSQARMEQLMSAAAKSPSKSPPGLQPLKKLRLSINEDGSAQLSPSTSNASSGKFVAEPAPKVALKSSFAPQSNELKSTMKPRPVAAKPMSITDMMLEEKERDLMVAASLKRVAEAEGLLHVPPQGLQRPPCFLNQNRRRGSFILNKLYKQHDHKQQHASLPKQREKQANRYEDQRDHQGDSTAAQQSVSQQTTQPNNSGNQRHGIERNIIRRRRPGSVSPPPQPGVPLPNDIYRTQKCRVCRKRFSGNLKELRIAKRAHIWKVHLELMPATCSHCVQEEAEEPFRGMNAREIGLHIASRHPGKPLRIIAASEAEERAFQWQYDRCFDDPPEEPWDRDRFTAFVHSILQGQQVPS